MTDFTPDAFALRTTDAKGRSYNDTFQWPLEIGAVVTAPDWSSRPKCGGGLHGLPDGLGDYDLLDNAHDALWWVVSFVRAESVDLDGKVKFPRCRVEYFGRMPGAMKLISTHCVKRMLSLAKENTSAGNHSPAVSAGYHSHAVSAGNHSPAVSAGNHSHAVSAGDHGHAVSAGYHSHAVSAGNHSHAVSAGNRSHAAAAGKNAVAAAIGVRSIAKASIGGAICLAAYDDNDVLVAVRSSLVGQNGVEPDVWYQLTTAGEFERVADVAQ